MESSSALFFIKLLALILLSSSQQTCAFVSHLVSDNHERTQRVRLSASDFGALPVKEGMIQVTRGEEANSFDLSYKLVRPMSLSSRQAAPMVVLHGGPSVPSNYLYPLANHIPYRSILFYDQLGCGKSDEPTDLNMYSIEQAIDDLELVLKKLSIRRFHIYGQSYGGILAFEYLKRCAERGKTNNDEEGCLSVVLSSSPTNVRQVEEEAQRLVEQLSSPELFRETHQCRTVEMPQPLADAYTAAGTVWRGTTAIQDYSAQAPSGDATTMPSALVLRGEHDFVTEACRKDWKELFNSRSVRERTLKDCSHHGLLESGPMYGEMVNSFFGEYD
jgi:pimeloyl-ACP methyl ester carboxylesterase